jgi:uncharacterized repeat protein (TIGR01451 family)
MVIGLAQQTLQAQTLGGIPDPTFNVGDSGLAAVQLNLSSQLFYPGPHGGVFVSAYQKLKKRQTTKRQVVFHNEYHYKNGMHGTFNFSNGMGEVMEVGVRNYYQVTNLYSAYTLGFDSLLITRLTVSEPNTLPLQNVFPLFKPLKGDYKTGAVQTTPSRLVFWLTHHPTDTTEDQVHTQTYLRSLDTSGAPLPATVTIPNFRAVKASYSQGKVYFLGFDLNSVPAATSKIVVVDATTLNILPQSFSGLGSNLISGNVQVFKVLNDGRMMVAGSLFNLEQVMRLNADGSSDNTFSPSPFAARTKWVIDETNTIRCGAIRQNGLNLEAAMAVVQPNGGFVTSTHTISSDYGLGQCLMYHPDYNAFLFESAPIRPNVIIYDDAVSYEIYRETVFGTKFRFYVGFNGAKWPLVNHDGAGMFDEQINLDVNPTISNRFLAYGDFTQVNRRMMPGLAMMKADGQLDTTFRSVMRLPNDSLKYSILYGRHHAHLTNSGKVLVSFPTRTLSYSHSVRINWQDTLRRLNQDGSKDLSYGSVWHHGTLTRGKDGKYYSIRYYENGIPTPVPTPGPFTTGKLLVLDEEGNFVEERGPFLLNGLYPDTIPASIYPVYHHNFICQDEAGGVWKSVEIYGGIGRQYFVRFDPNGSSRLIYPRFVCHTVPLKIEILPGKRMRWTGAFGTTDTTFGKVVNVLETDSTGNLDYAFTPKIFFVPDAYGGRSKYYAAPVKYTPDGKMLAFLHKISDVYPTPIGDILIRLQASGKQDNSFMPIKGNLFVVLSPFNVPEMCSLGILGDRLLMGVQNFNKTAIRYTPPFALVGTSFKNGIHAFGLKSTPANTGYIQGRVTQVVSPATGCNPTVAQKSLNGMVIRTAPSNRIALTDTGGYYSIPVLMGNHTVNQTIENNFLQRQVCPVPPTMAHNASIPSAGSASLGNDFINQTYACPRLDLKVLDPRFRLCSRTSFQIQYKNDGIAPQPNARIRVNLPEEIRILSASRPYTKDVDSSYVFDLGTLQPGQYGTITTVDTIACPAQPDSLARACFSARIEPLSLCANIDPASILWDGAWLDAVARYNPTSNKVRVVVYNKGANMADSTVMKLTGPGMIYKDGKIKLAAGDSLVTLCEPALQGSIQLQLAQPASCPLGSNSSLNHSGRGTARSFLNFGPGLLETYTAQACPTWRFSYDPNEKLVEPSGDIEPGTDLDYTIHFENYGNDTAYAVTVVDSLPAGLDVTTFRRGASSDKYELEMGGDVNQPIVYFHFREIKLTGKKQDSIRSKGQVSFKIRSNDNVVRGSKISNRAHIYFDRNAAVTTEYVHSPIATLGLVSGNENILHSNNRMILAPNPASGTVKIWFTNSGATVQNPVPVQIISLDGREVKQISYTGIQTEVSGLHPGVYIVQSAGSRPQKLIIVQ